MELHIYSLKTESQASNIWSQNTQLWILKIYAFCQKIQQMVLGPGESAAGVMYLSREYTWKIVVSSP